MKPSKLKSSKKEDQIKLNYKMEQINQDKKDSEVILETAQSCLEQVNQRIEFLLQENQALEENLKTNKEEIKKIQKKKMNVLNSKNKYV